ncbi:lycopene cyclase domain-containing protein [Pedobacter sp. SD-b]|uniref:Lycopene cyclase domain-containing protein n=1 Tax=Pedobacter segetis TaxID=2793069 RepID=A0ABS1BIW2_9SPHI|nr:lycopene cyclase domain-containing protein [Pedobacter segetis]MBK0382778.1 lycopene cyclase domain-containing protein [Pedobacter segetis]
MDKHYTYLLINVLTVLFPIFLSFDKKVSFFKKWKFILPGMFLSGSLYLLWDYLFTINQVWSFNPDYILGIKFFGLPLEEILFFITVPFACIFIYECLLCYFKLYISRNISKMISYILLLLCIVLVFLYHDRLYSLINFSTLAIILVFTLLKDMKLDMGKFFVAYLVSLIPFYIVNGILTAIPIVSYNNAENMGFRVGTVPFEDHFYSMSLILLNLIFFEYFRNKKTHATAS